MPKSRLPSGDLRRDSAHEPAVDFAFFAEQTLNDRDLQAELASLFKGCATEYFQTLSNPASDEDWRMAAHALKGASYNVGARRLGELCKQAETALDQSQRDQLLGKIDTAMSAALRELAAQFDDTTTLDDSAPTQSE